MTINFSSSKDTNQERAIHSKIDNFEVRIMTNDDLEEIIEELFKSLFTRYCFRNAN